jgi:TrfA protein.
MTRFLYESVESTPEEKAAQQERYKRVAETNSKFKKDSESKQLSFQFPDTFPVLPNSFAPMNNYLAKSSIFAPIKRGKRAYRKNILKYKSDLIEIRVTGEQLDMSDEDLFFELMILVQGKPHTEPVITSRYHLLSELKKCSSGNNYKWLHQSILRLVGTTIDMTYGRQNCVFNLVGKVTTDEATDKMIIHFQPESLALFANARFAFINKLNRERFKNKVDLCKWLQTYVSSNRKGEHHQISLIKLQEHSGGYGGDIRTFKLRLKIAINELLSVKELEEGYISEDNIFHYVRPKHHGKRLPTT